MLREFFVRSNSFAAPFLSDMSTSYITAETPEEALEAYAESYSHPFGLYAAEVYESADDYHKRREPLASWLSNHELAVREAKRGEEGFSYLGRGPGDFDVNGKTVKVEDPKAGRVVAGRGT